MKVHCICTAPGRFCHDGKTYRMGDPITVSEEVFEQYEGTHLDKVENVPEASDEEE